MTVKKIAVAGTLESCDVMITLEPSDHLELSVESTVKELFGDAIAAQVKKTLADLGVTTAKVTIQDHGALDYTLAARVETAVRRASN